MDQQCQPEAEGLPEAHILTVTQIHQAEAVHLVAEEAAPQVAETVLQAHAALLAAQGQTLEKLRLELQGPKQQEAKVYQPNNLVDKLPTLELS